MSRILLAENYRLLLPALTRLLVDGGHQVLHANSDKEVVTRLADADNVPDLLLIDLDMARCGGLNTVRYVRRLSPGRQLKILGLTNRRDREWIVESLRTGVTSLILKEDCTPEELLHRIGQMTSAAAAPHTAPAPRAGVQPIHAPVPSTAVASGAANAPVSAHASCAIAPAHDAPKTAHTTTGAIPPAPLKSSELEAHLPALLEARALRPVVQQVIAMTANPNVDPHALVSVLRNDVGLSAKVIAAANSAFYRRRNVVVGTLLDAINVIGMTNTRNLAMSLSVVDQFRNDSSDPLLAMPRLWGHSISTAHLCESLARASGTCRPDEAFVVGLLHDIGRMMLAEHFAAHYAHVVHTAPEEAPALIELERRVVGADHALVGSLAADRWGCPSFISRATRLHHSAAIQSDEGEDPLGGLLRTLLLADAMAIAVGQGGDDLEELPTLPRGWLSRVIPDPMKFRDDAIGSLQEMQGLLMSRTNLAIELPETWAGNCEQIVVLGTALHPLEPLQLMLAHAYPMAIVCNPTQADASIRRTLLLADLRGARTPADAAAPISAFIRAKPGAIWPILAVCAAATAEGLRVEGRPITVIAPPLRPCVLRRRVEALLSMLAR